MDSYVLSDNEIPTNKDINIQYENNTTTKPLLEKKFSKLKTVRKPRTVKKNIKSNEDQDNTLEIATNKVSEVINETFENNNAILVIKQDKVKKQTISKYINEDFINLCIDARIKTNPQGEIEYKLGDSNFANYKEDLIKLIMYVNSNIQNCHLKTITCNNCKVEKNYTEFKELSTSSTGRQKNCLSCSSKVSIKSILNVKDLNLDDE
jgi:hypothetical protein